MAVVADRAAEPVTAPSRPPRDSSDVEATATRAGWVLPTAIALAVLLTALLVPGVIFGVQTVRGFADERGRAAVVAAGETVATNLTTFDFAAADADVTRLAGSTTPTFSRGFGGDQAAFVKSLRQDKVSMTGTPVSAGVLSYDGRSARVLVAIKARMTTATAPQPQLRDYRLDLAMVYQDGHWLADSAGFVS